MENWGPLTTQTMYLQGFKVSWENTGYLKFARIYQFVLEVSRDMPLFYGKFYYTFSDFRSLDTVMFSKEHACEGPKNS